MTLPLNSELDPSNPIENARYNMVQQQVRPWEVSSDMVLSAMYTVRREDFVPEAHRVRAFMDMEIPLVEDADAVQRGLCMLSPKIDARMINDLGIQSHEKVLEIGSGSGYSAALLSRLCASVVTLEILPALVAQARKNLEAAGCTNVTARMGDGATDAFSEGPFDVILLSGSVEVLPELLLHYLKPGGRLGAIVGRTPVMKFTIVHKAADGSLHTVTPWDTVQPRLQSFAQAERFTF